ncbi:MAG: molybdopterin-dependent oxidoreductase, partial [Alphaproteobacteria bacterium]|nr:molybdopterin-dependent oxidoreductase [Alphaproteobacteria bacterium]
GVPVGYWRSTGTSSNGFVVESFIDELAAAANRDPLAYRLDHLGGKPRHRAALVNVAELSNWNEPAGPNRGRGVALIESSDSICAQVVEVYVSPRWELKIERVCCVFDCRQLIHPDSVRAQLESSVVDGLSAALYGEITLVDGVVQQSNFDTYRVLGLRETPRIDIELLPQGGRPGGVGEPAVPAAAPALANAIYAATGRRIRNLPISRNFGPA